MRALLEWRVDLTPAQFWPCLSLQLANLLTMGQSPMKRFTVSLVLFCATSPPTLAEFPQELHKAAPICAPLMESTGLIETGYGSAIEDIESGCRLSAIYAGLGGYQRLRIETLEIIAPDLEAALINQRQFEEARISIKCARISPDFGYPLQSYITEMQVRPFDLDLDYRWNAETGDLDISQLRAEGAVIGTWSLSARLKNVPDLGLARTGAVAADFGIETLSLTFAETELVLGYVLPLVLNTLPYDEDPAPHIEAGIAEFADAIANAPETNISPASKTVLTDWISRFPNLDGAAGTLDIGGTDKPLPFEKLFIEDAETFSAFLKAAQISAQSTP